MTLDIPRYRLHNQFLSQTDFTEPSQVVECLGAVQSQDYAGAKWALAQRFKDAPTDAEIEKAFNEGKILRTHVLRPTWHFVTPTDIRWMLDLTAPRVKIAMAHMDRQLGLDKSVLKKSNNTLGKALQGNGQLTRSELAPILKKAGVPVDGYHLGQLMGHAELDQIICSGGREGKQFTYALLEERAPQAKSLEREDALVELTKRYFKSHGPATLQDFVWWSGLTTTDARKGMEAVKSEFEQETIADQTYWFSVPTLLKNSASSAYLLPNYDEYTVGYRDRSAIFDRSHIDKLSAFRESILTQVLVINGEVSGTWKRTLKKNEVIVEFAPFTALTNGQNQAVVAAAQRYGKFLQLPVLLL
jgi:winged helix DNA-binding protein